MKKVSNKLVNFVVAFLVWMLLSREMSWPSVIVGFLVAGIVALASSKLFSESSDKILDIRRWGYFLIYAGIFLEECFKANIDVASRVIRPDMPINPGIVKVKTRLKTEAGLTCLANSITLTPGTFCVDIDANEGVLYIHWIDVKDKDAEKATEIIAKRFENIIAKVFE